MKFFDDLVCPISEIKIDNNASRLNAFLIVIFLVLYLVTHQFAFVLLCAVDYGIRVAEKPEYSPLLWLAKKIAKTLKLPVKPKDQAPKLFASRLGLFFSGLSTLLFALSLPASLVFAGILMFFATLDSVFNICVGCLTYTYVVLPIYRARGIR